MTDPVMPQAAATQDDSHEHISTVGSSVLIWIILLVCTGLTAAVAFVDLGPANTIVALTIATFKAILVVLFFMHVKYTHEKLTGLVIASAIFFLLILLALSMADYTTRLWR
ncbi:MAG TPA: cytochrome C oxidase subunit IV family protein [Terriglobales bacterium]|nr:cytochrome C oxidase subunit IV family protein [Terriglobales bacterium]